MLYRLFRAGALAAIVALTLCCALLFPENTGTDSRETRKSAVAFTPAKASTTGTTSGAWTQTADLAPVHAVITAPELRTEGLRIAGTPAKLSAPVTSCSGRAPPSAA